jgi:hypothetical protein
MASANEVPVTLPAEVAEHASAFARQENCALNELFREVLHRAKAFGNKLTNAIASGEEHSDALEDFLIEHTVRMVHKSRAERKIERSSK